MNIQQNTILAPLTTFRIGGSARYFAEITDPKELPLVFEFAQERFLPTLFLGGGSNMLISDRGFGGLLLHIKTRGFNVIKEDDDNATVRVMGGEIWDDVVERSVGSAWWGIENLSLIPGSAGAAPIQNIGAYGREISDVIQSVEVYDTHSQSIKRFSRSDCGFGYRKSIFNGAERGRYVVLSITIELAKSGEPNISYPDIQTFFHEKKIEHPSLQQIREAIITIRTRKLIDPRDAGNVGSFFKNLVLTAEEYEILRKNIKGKFHDDASKRLDELKNRVNPPTMSPGASEAIHAIKIPTAFLIDLCGLKGETVGGAQISEKQPLVIINMEGKATAHDVMSLFKKIRQRVYQLTGMKLENEPHLAGFSKEEMDEYFSIE